jgi:hypothetical protein
MKEVVIEDITVDVCEGGCGGLWFDPFELQKVDEPTESAGEKLLDVDRNPSVVVDRDARRNCLKCDGTIMMRHFFSVKREVEVDECPSCAGIFLDAGELATIRSQYATQEERRAATQNYFNDIFGSQLESMRKESEEKAEKARKIANAFWFICPSYYVPGKQDWGAF